MKKGRESMASLKTTRAVFEDDHEYPIEFCCYLEPHDNNHFLLRVYLLFVVRLNLFRVSLQLNQSNDIEKYCNLISEDRKPHQINSTCLHNHSSLLQGKGDYQGFHRSNSFSNVPSTLETSIAVYEHVTT